MQIQKTLFQDFYGELPNEQLLLQQNVLIITHNNIFESKIIKLYQNFLIEIPSQTQFHNSKFRIMKYEINILIEISKVNLFSQDYSSLIFQINSDRQIYYVQEKQKMQRIRMILKQKLNQKKFYDYYKARKKIGCGNFASVYMVQRLIDKKKFAAKIFYKQSNYIEKRDKDSVQNEIKIMRHLDHQNLIHLEQVFESDTTIFIVMQLLEDGRLYDLTKNRHQFRSNQVKIILKNLLNGLEYLQKKNIIHRDLKPQNVMFRNKEKLECVIVDFGLATYAHEEYIYLRCGTPGYTSPQIINVKSQKNKFTPVSDMFSLGVIFYQLLTGEKIFKGQTKNQVFLKNKEAKIDFLQFSKKFGRVEFDILDLMLKKNANLRIHANKALVHQYFKNVPQNVIFSEQQQNIAEQNPNLQHKMMMVNKMPKISMKLLNQSINQDKIKRKDKPNQFDSNGSYKMTQFIYYGNTKTTDSNIDISSSQFQSQNSSQNSSKILFKCSQFSQNAINKKKRNIS